MLPDSGGSRRYLHTNAEIAEKLGAANSTGRTYFAKECSVEKQREAAPRLAALPQPAPLRNYLLGIANGLPDDEMMRLLAAAKEQPASALPSRPGRLIVPSIPPAPVARPMTPKQIKDLGPVRVPSGVRNGDRVLVYAKRHAEFDGHFEVAQGKIAIIGLETWHCLLRVTPRLSDSLRLITEPTAEDLAEALDLDV